MTDSLPSAARPCLRKPTRSNLAWTVAFLLAPSLAGCGGPGGGHAEPPPSKVKLARRVEVRPAETKNIVYAIDTVGTLEPERETSIAPGVAGVIDEVLFKEGDAVDPKRTILIKIDQRRYEAEAALARANEEKAKARLDLTKDLADRAQLLRKSRAIAEEESILRAQEMQIAAAELAAAQASRQMAEVRLDKSRVRPPYAGQINERRVAVGDYVKEETVIATIADGSTLRLNTFVPELAAPRIKAGDTLEFTLEAVPGKKFQARIMYVSTVADAQTHMFACKAAIPHPRPEMKPGMFARVQIPTERHPDACVIPEEAVRAGEQGFVVFVPQADHSEGLGTKFRARLRRVQVGLRRPGFVEILSGVAPGELVVTRGSEALEDGTLIEIIDQAAVGGDVPASPSPATSQSNPPDARPKG